ncbi:MAG TPA: hypothetical protein VFT98_21820, partial [Myxococcota bacterium]|nr:hypothetical protein [Myxococcota bacterium]
FLPERENLPPSYEQKHFYAADRSGSLRLVASRNSRDGSLRVHQDVDLYAALLCDGESVSHALRPGCYAWLQMAHGRCTLNGTALEAGDGAAVSGESSLRIASTSNTEMLLHAQILVPVLRSDRAHGMASLTLVEKPSVSILGVLTGSSHS